MANKSFTVKHGLNPVTDGSIDLGTSSLEFKDLYIDGTAFLDAVGFGTTAITLPSGAGNDGQVLKSNGSNALAWADVAPHDMSIAAPMKVTVVSGTVWTLGWWQSSDGRWWLLGNTANVNSFARADAEFYIPTGDISDVPSS
jgi:hypothetical protein